jgi:hypothetical protein
LEKAFLSINGGALPFWKARIRDQLPVALVFAAQDAVEGRPQKCAVASVRPQHPGTDRTALITASGVEVSSV